MSPKCSLCGSDKIIDESGKALYCKWCDRAETQLVKLIREVELDRVEEIIELEEYDE